MRLQSVCVFSGSSPGARSRYTEVARDLGAALATRGIRVVYGGASIGLMGEVADAARAAGGAVTGVIPRALVEREIAHDGLDELRVVEGMHERKAMMNALSDAFVALPGGVGTLEELFEAWTWRQLGLHEKPVGLLDADGYWERLLAFLAHANAEGFVRDRDLARLAVAERADELLDDLAERAAADRAGLRGESTAQASGAAATGRG